MHLTDLLKWSVGDQQTFFPYTMSSLIQSQVTREVGKIWMSGLLGLR